MEQGAEMEARRTSWSAVQDAFVYDRGRPDYAEAAVDFALEPVRDRPGLRALDVGAGTGKLTGQLLRRGVGTVAVEPSEAMRHVLAHRCRQATVLAGAAEDLPLGDGAVDLVVAGQAFHWFRRAEALAEITRVLRPGGVFALFYNARQDAVRWVAALSEVIHETGDHVSETQDFHAPELAGFAPPETVRVAHEQELDADGLVDLVASRSYAILMPPDERARLLDRVRELTRTHPELVGRQHFAMPYVTTCERYRLRS